MVKTENLRFVAVSAKLQLPRVIVAALVSAVIGVLAWPIWPWAAMTEIELKIVATGEKSPAAHSSEVWITSLPYGMSAARLARHSATPDGWEVRSGTLLSYRNQPATIFMRLKADPNGVFVLTRHAWSGHVAISVNGVTRDLDLYAADPNEMVLRLDEFPLGPAKPFGLLKEFFVAAAIAFTAIFALLTGLALALSRLREPDHHAKAYFKRILLFSFPALVVFSFVLVGTWPAQMSGDSVDQWNQVHTGVLGVGHPPAHTFLFAGLGRLFGTVGAGIMLQIVLLALVIGWLCAELERWRTPVPLGWAVAFVTPLFPSVALVSTVLWKDIPYTIALAALAALALIVARTGGAVAKSWGFVVLMAVALFLSAAFRHNGLLVALGMVTTLFVIYRKQIAAKAFALWAVSGVVLPLLLTTVLLPALGVEKIGPHYGGMNPMHFLAGVAAANRELAPTTKQRMNEVLPLDRQKQLYDCLTVVPLFWAKGINYNKIDASLYNDALHAALANPDIALSHAFCVNSINWRLSPPINAERALIPFGALKDPDGEKPWSVTQNPAPLARAILERVHQATIAKPWLFALFWRPGAIFLAILTLVVVVGRWRREVYLGLLPPLLNTMSLAPLLAAQDFRYQYPAYVVGLPMIFLLLGLWSQRLAAGRKYVDEGSR